MPDPRTSPYHTEVHNRNDGVTMALLGLMALPALQCYLWVQAGRRGRRSCWAWVRELAALAGWGWWARDFVSWTRSLLALMPDKARLRQARRLFTRYPGPVYLTMEKDAARLLADDRVWHAASAPTLLSLREVLAHLRPGGMLLWEPPSARLSLPDDIGLAQANDGVADHLLPVVLKPAEKRMLDCLADWPLITAEDLGGILGLWPSGVSKLTVRLGEFGLVTAVLLDGQRRLALSQKGLALMARSDRGSVTAAFRRWSVESMDGDPPSSWRDVSGERTRPLARAIDHTLTVHTFMAALARQAKGTPGCRVLQLSPPHHSARHFRHGAGLRSIHPDGFGVVQASSAAGPFFLEWERRALHPSTMAARLAPYLRYSSSNRPLEDYRERLLALILFEDSLAEANFLGGAQREMGWT